MQIQTCRQFSSDIVGSLRSLGIDDRIPTRLVLAIGRDYTRTFIKQDADSRRLFQITDIWKSIPCFQMCEEDAVKCGCLPDCQYVMKSTKQLPAVFDSSYGDVIKIFTIDGSKEYTLIKSFEYKDIKNREYQNSGQRYCWILDRYLYIPDSKVKEVMVVGLFMFPNEVTKLVEGSECLYPLDEYFPCPGYLLSVVKDQTIKKLAEIYKRLIPDAKPDGNPNSK